MIKFTKEEKLALIFLLGFLFIGVAVGYYKKVAPKKTFIAEFNKQKIENPKKININKAKMSELIGLKHVGPAIAERIVLHRRKYGPFMNKEDLKNVKGIGDKTYEKIKDEIALE